VRLEVLRQLANPFAQQRDLDFWASRVACVGSVLVDEGFFALWLTLNWCTPVLNRLSM